MVRTPSGALQPGSQAAGWLTGRCRRSVWGRRALNQRSWQVPGFRGAAVKVHREVGPGDEGAAQGHELRLLGEPAERRAVRDAQREGRARDHRSHA